MDSFFCAGDVLASFLDDLLGILLGQLPVWGVTGQRVLDGRQFVGRHMPGVILALLPAWKFVMPSG